jgi:CheY-like chemotaxis protein
MKVLIIDDEPDIGFILSFELRGLGHETEAFVSAFEAMEYLKTNTPDAILCDFQMPRMNGLDFFLWLKENNYSIPFYILTGEPTMDTQQLLQSGIKDILFKPQDLLRLKHYFK